MSNRVVKPDPVEVLDAPASKGFTLSAFVDPATYNFVSDNQSLGNFSFAVPGAATVTLGIVEGKSAIVEFRESRERALRLALQGDRAKLLIWNGSDFRVEQRPWTEVTRSAAKISYDELPWLLPELSGDSLSAEPRFHAEWRLVKPGDILVLTDSGGAEIREQILKTEGAVNTTKRWVTSVRVHSDGKTELLSNVLRSDLELAHENARLIKRDLHDGSIGQTVPRVASAASIKIEKAFDELLNAIEDGFSAELMRTSARSTARSAVDSPLVELRPEAMKIQETLIAHAAGFYSEFRLLRQSFESLLTYCADAHIAQATNLHGNFHAKLLQINSLVWGNAELNYEQRLKETLEQLDRFVIEQISPEIVQTSAVQRSLKGFREHNSFLLTRVAEKLRLSESICQEPPQARQFDYSVKLEGRPDDALLARLEALSLDYVPAPGTTLRPGKNISAPMSVNDLRKAVAEGVDIFTLRTVKEGQSVILGFMTAYAPNFVPTQMRNPIHGIEFSSAYVDMIVMDKHNHERFPNMPSGLGAYALMEAAMLHYTVRGAQALEAEIRVQHEHFQRLFKQLLGFGRPLAIEVTATPVNGTREYWEKYFFSLVPQERAVLEPLVTNAGEDNHTLIEVLSQARQRQIQPSRGQVSDLSKGLGYEQFCVELSQAKAPLCARIGGSAANATNAISSFRNFIERGFKAFGGAALYGDTEMLQVTDGLLQRNAEGKLIAREGVMSAGSYIRQNCPDAKTGGIIIEPERGLQKLPVMDGKNEIELEIMSDRPIVNGRILSPENYISAVAREHKTRLRLPSEIGSTASVYQQELEWALQICLDLLGDSYGGKVPVVCEFGGGGVTAREIQIWGDLGLPIILVNGSGGAADHYAADKKWRDSVVDVNGKPLVFDVPLDHPEKLEAILAHLVEEYSGEGRRKLLHGKAHPDIIGFSRTTP